MTKPEIESGQKKPCKSCRSCEGCEGCDGTRCPVDFGQPCTAET